MALSSRGQPRPSACHVEIGWHKGAQVGEYLDYLPVSTVTTWGMEEAGEAEAE